MKNQLKNFTMDHNSKVLEQTSRKVGALVLIKANTDDFKLGIFKNPNIIKLYYGPMDQSHNMELKLMLEASSEISLFTCIKRTGGCLADKFFKRNPIFIRKGEIGENLKRLMSIIVRKSQVIIKEIWEIFREHLN
jgi:hypothetical protein